MKRRIRILTAGALAVAVAAVFAAYGSASSLSRAHAAKSASTVTLLMGSAPQSLDPQFDYTTQGAEDLWVSYIGLTTYQHANGAAGSVVIPGLCTALPKVSNHGKTYSCTLRKGLTFSNGKPVVASAAVGNLRSISASGPVGGTPRAPASLRISVWSAGLWPITIADPVSAGSRRSRSSS